MTHLFGQDETVTSFFIYHWRTSILGSFGSQAETDIDGFGVRWGAYTHNIFVYWDQFGIIGFAFIVFVILTSWYNNKTQENCGN